MVLATMPQWTYSLVFYSIIFVIFCIGSVTLVPFLMAINLAISCTVLVQSLILFGPFAPQRRIGGFLLDAITKVQKAVQIPLMVWFGILHLPLIFPLAMVAHFVLPYLVLNLIPPPLQRAIISMPLRLGLRHAQHMNSVPRTIVGLWRAIFRSLILCIVTPGRACIPGQITSRDDYWLLLASDTLWWIINTRIAEAIVTGLVRVTKKAQHVGLWMQGLVTVLWQAGMHQRDGTHIFMIEQVRTMLMLPAAFCVPPFILLQKSAAQLDSAIYLDARRKNASLYRSASVLLEGRQGAQRRTWTRLLTIHPRQTYGEAITCTLRSVNISDPNTEAYEALSYVWGPPEMDQSITINSQGFYVSKILLDALLQLRRHTLSRTVWIDAICINQDDISERSVQVAIMQHIYSTASSVIVSLGKDAPWGLAQLADSAKSEQIPSPPTSAATHVLSAVMHKPWWSRVWTVQELLVAKQVIVCCGAINMTWDCLGQLVDAGLCKPDPVRNSMSLPSRADGFNSLRAGREERLRLDTAVIATNSKSATRRSRDLVALVYDFRHRAATEPRDRVFAFLGLVGLQEKMLLEPDYAQPISVLSKDLARAHIRKTRTLAIMALAECARSSSPERPDRRNNDWGDYIPSWCPAFMSDAAVSAGLNWRPFWTGLSPVAAEETEVFSAAGNHPVLLVPPLRGEPSDDPDSAHSFKLAVQTLSGFSSTITKVGPAATASLRDLGMAAQMVLEKHQGTFTESWQSRLAWETVLPRWRALAQEARGTSAAIDEVFTVTITGGKFTSVPTSTAGHDSKGIGSLESYLRARQEACIGRRFFATDDGRVGLGPAGLQVGDEVDVVLGLQVPAVLRKASRAWDGNYVDRSDDDCLYVGQAYLHEWMTYSEEGLVRDLELGLVGLRKRLIV